MKGIDTGSSQTGRYFFAVLLSRLLQLKGIHTGLSHHTFSN
jgi:hypothetical protein